MLTKPESKVMDFIYENARDKKTVMFAPKQILSAILPKHEITVKQLDSIMRNLALDGYIDVRNSEKKGNQVYVVTMKLRGEAWTRERAEATRRVVRRIGFQVALACIGFAITYLLWEIIGN